MFEFLTVVFLVMVVGGFAMVGLILGALWLGWRRLRRHPLVATGRMAVEGALAVSVLRGQLTANPKGALRSMRLGRQQRRLRHRVQSAERAGAYLGDIPGLLPRLEDEGRRIRAALASPTASVEVLTQADHHLSRLAELSAAVDGTTTVSSSDEYLSDDVREAALGLRLRNAAYAELMATNVPVRR
jgi:hypothetical protein